MTLVCPRCFNEPGLQRRIEELRAKSPPQKCSFHPRYKGVPIAEVAEIVDHVFRGHYSIGEPMFGGGQDGDGLSEVILDLTGAEDDQIVEALIDQLIEGDDYWPPDGGEPFYAEDQNYVAHTPDGYHHSQMWREFCESIVHDQRFFNTNARKLIAEIFDGLHLQMDQDKSPPVYQLVPGEDNSSIYRARIATGEDGAKDILERPIDRLGPPPDRLRKPGRMNAAGVQTFYGAFDLATCIAELRPAVGSLVVGARFELIRPIYVLDTTKFIRPMKQISLFAKDQLRRVEQWQFMARFMHEISKPVSPDDEYIDYIPTQAVAEFFAHQHEFMRRGASSRIEAIIYKSAQNSDGRNIAVLANAARLVRPPSGEKTSRLPDFLSQTMSNFVRDRQQQPEPALRLVESTLQTLVVHGAQFQTRQLNEARFDDEV